MTLDQKRAKSKFCESGKEVLMSGKQLQASAVGALQGNHR